MMALELPDSVDTEWYFIFLQSAFQKPSILSLAFRDIWIIQPKALALQLREQGPKKSGDACQTVRKEPFLALISLPWGPLMLRGKGSGWFKGFFTPEAFLLLIGTEL